jgi:hypothetical protein
MRLWGPERFDPNVADRRRQRIIREVDAPRRQSCALARLLGQRALMRQLLVNPSRAMIACKRRF